MVSALVPTYVSECTPRAIRGRCTGMIQLANNIGIMLSCAFILYHCNETSFLIILMFFSLGQLQRLAQHTLWRHAMAHTIHRTDHSRISLHNPYAFSKGIKFTSLGICARATLRINIGISSLARRTREIRTRGRDTRLRFTHHTR
jgi:MFS family permease